ncbi:ubiquitin domain-containing protein UBFD1-like [Lineus longissimus]|uniref:ubiquitin domain-containing protein UBFD1-like n=1 Tax=Lineus longissimus TaxID=88925 RepID=UPI00315D9427
MEKEESNSTEAEIAQAEKNNMATDEAMDSGDKDTPTLADKTTEEPASVEEKENKEAPPGGGGECTDEVPKEEEVEKELVEFKIVYKKKPYDVKFPLDDKVSALKAHIEKLTELPPSMQKVMFRGLAKDESTLRELKVSKGAKLMVVGSTMTEVMSVSAPDPKEIKAEEKGAEAKKEPFCQQKQHKKVLEKYPKPDDAMPGFKNQKERLPSLPLAGMYNKFGGKVRLTFKLEVDQIWIGTKERTEKVNMSSIKAIVSEPIEGHEEYHIMGIQLGTTEASRYWIYWVPAQYVDSIKDTVLGKWQYF